MLEYLEKQLDGDYEEEQEESLDSKSFREENWFTEPEPVPQPQHKEALIEPLMEKIKDLVAQMPEESDRIDEFLDEMLPKAEETIVSDQITTEVIEAPLSEKIKSDENESESPNNINSTQPSANHFNNELEEFASSYKAMPQFERKQTNLFSNTVEVEEVKEVKKPTADTKVRSLNDTVGKGLNVGLNDRLAFIKHLFDGQVEDYSRVLSQINTMDNYEEAQSFILGQVKPDYNNWANKEVYSERFMTIIEKRFN